MTSASAAYRLRLSASHCCGPAACASPPATSFWEEADLSCLTGGRLNSGFAPRSAATTSPACRPWLSPAGVLPVSSAELSAVRDLLPLGKLHIGQCRHQRQYMPIWVSTLHAVVRQRRRPFRHPVVRDASAGIEYQNLRISEVVANRGFQHLCHEIDHAAKSRDDLRRFRTGI